jgi:hypothetical protein
MGQPGQKQLLTATRKVDKLLKITLLQYCLYICTILICILQHFYFLLFKLTELKAANYESEKEWRLKITNLQKKLTETTESMFKHVSERVMVVLTPNEPFFSSIMMRTSCIR